MKKAIIVVVLIIAVIGIYVGYQTFTNDVNESEYGLSYNVDVQDDKIVVDASLNYHNMGFKEVAFGLNIINIYFSDQPIDDEFSVAIKSYTTLTPFGSIKEHDEFTITDNQQTYYVLIKSRFEIKDKTIEFEHSLSIANGVVTEI